MCISVACQGGFGGGGGAGRRGRPRVTVEINLEENRVERDIKPMMIISDED